MEMCLSKKLYIICVLKSEVASVLSDWCLVTFS